MPCFEPLIGYRWPNGKVRLKPFDHNQVDTQQVPCGRCLGCRIDHARGWAIRSVHEAKDNKHNVFLTLTYRPEDLPAHGGLRHKDVQAFFKNTRRWFEYNHDGKFKYVQCGEYGSQGSRPHYHACVFGLHFPDAKPWKKTGSGAVIYRSEQLEKLWPHGFASIGEVNEQTAGYTARYTMKKLKEESPEKDSQDNVHTDEYLVCSKGIGLNWLQKNWPDVYPADQVVIKTKSGYRSYKPPRYYDKKVEEWRPDIMEKVKAEREAQAKRDLLDPKKPIFGSLKHTERMAHRAEFKKQQLQQLRRELEE